jgi:hypothetical protein
LQAVFTKLTQPIVDFVKKITETIKGFDTVYTSADNARKGIKRVIPDTKALAEKFEMLLPVLAAATAGFATFAGRALLPAVPILGALFSKLSPFPVALLVLALTSTQVRKALINLFTAFKPLVPIIVQIGKVMATASVIGVAVLAKAINILAGIVRGVIGFVQRKAREGRSRHHHGRRSGPRAQRDRSPKGNLSSRTRTQSGQPFGREEGDRRGTNDSRLPSPLQEAFPSRPHHGTGPEKPLRMLRENAG